jgi:hypothetical protein
VGCASRRGAGPRLNPGGRDQVRDGQSPIDRVRRRSSVRMSMDPALRAPMFHVGPGEGAAPQVGCGGRAMNAGMDGPARAHVPRGTCRLGGGAASRLRRQAMNAGRWAGRDRPGFVRYGRSPIDHGTPPKRRTDGHGAGRDVRRCSTWIACMRSGLRCSTWNTLRRPIFRTERDRSGTDARHLTQGDHVADPGTCIKHWADALASQAGAVGNRAPAFGSQAVQPAPGQLHPDPM